MLLTRKDNSSESKYRFWKVFKNCGSTTEMLKQSIGSGVKFLHNICHLAFTVKVVIMFP